MVESDGLLNRCTGSNSYRGFESRPLRSDVPANAGGCQQVAEVPHAQPDSESSCGCSSDLPESPSVPPDDCRRTGDGHSSDKADDKLSDKLDSEPDGPLPPDEDALAGVIGAWPRLPKTVRTAILALVQAVTKD